VYVPHWRVTSATPSLRHLIDIFRASSPHGTPIRFFLSSLSLSPLPADRPDAVLRLYPVAFPLRPSAGGTFPGARRVSPFLRYPVPHRQFLSRLYIGYVGVPCLLVVSPPSPCVLARALASPWISTAGRSSGQAVPPPAGGWRRIIYPKSAY